jgi:hypothetical protein
VEVIRKTKEEHWYQWLEKANDQTVWRMHKTVLGPASDGGKPRIPAPKDRNGQDTSDNAKKSQILHKTFFPPPPEHQPHDDNDHEFPEPIEPFRNITNYQIERAINRMSPHKAVMANDIANVVLKE